MYPMLFFLEYKHPIFQCTASQVFQLLLVSVLGKTKKEQDTDVTELGQKMQLAMLPIISVSAEFKRQNNVIGTRITIQVSAIHAVREAYRYTGLSSNEITNSSWGSENQLLFCSTS